MTKTPECKHPAWNLEITADRCKCRCGWETMNPWEVLKILQRENEELSQKLDNHVNRLEDGIRNVEWDIDRLRGRM